MSLWSSTIKTATKAVPKIGFHPIRTAKSIAVLGVPSFIGWQAYKTGKSMGEVTSEIVIGKPATQAIGDTAQKVYDTVNGLSSATDEIRGAAQDSRNIFSGISDFFSSLTQGNSGNMIGNFFSNLFSGKVGSGSIVGLIAAAIGIFGKFGWMGKIAGALLGMMMIGNNSRVSLSQANLQQGVSLSQNKDTSQHIGLEETKEKDETLDKNIAQARPVVNSEDVTAQRSRGLTR